MPASVPTQGTQASKMAMGPENKEVQGGQKRAQGKVLQFHVKHSVSCKIAGFL